MRSVLIAAALLFTHIALAADSAAWTDTGLRGRFVRADGTFACDVKLDRAATDADRKRATQLACLHIGPFAIGTTEATLLKKLGNPDDMRPAARGAINYVYVKDPAFIVVTVQAGLIVAIELIGPDAIDDFSFNGIDLGSSRDAVTALFGRPKKIGPTGSPGVERWLYQPWTFSFDFTDGEVTSIRVANEEFR